MQKNINYAKILFEYDTIGPIIAGMIKQDITSDQELWIQFYNFYLLPVTNFLSDDKYDEAISRYTEMVNALKDYYGINENIEEVAKDYDMAQGGHGKIKNLAIL